MSGLNGEPVRTNAFHVLKTRERVVWQCFLSELNSTCTDGATDSFQPGVKAK